MTTTEFNITKKDFQFEEDFVLSYECGDCHYYEDWSLEVEPSNCSKCGSEDVLNNTSHEGDQCDICNFYFNLWNDGYRYMGNDEEFIKHQDSQIICDDCYQKLKN